MSQTTDQQQAQERNVKDDIRSIDLGLTPREAGTYRLPGEGDTDPTLGDGNTAGGSSWLAIVLWLGAALLGMNGLTTFAGSISALFDPSVSAWGSMGLFIGLGMLVVAALLALAARSIGKRRD